MRDRPTDLDKKIFVNNLLSILFAGNDIKISLHFYMTHYCNLRCPGCYMAAGPHRSQAVISLRDIDFYMRQFSKISDFDKNVVFSGGEIFTLSLDYLQYNIQNALDLGMNTEVKTNGTWVRSGRRADKIFDMLRGLKMRQPLDMAVSVDNKIHPAYSADCFVDIATRLAGDDKLSKNIILKSFSFIESAQFFQSHVFNRLTVRDFSDFSDCICTYRVGKLRVGSVFGNFIDSTAPQSAVDASNIVYSAFGDDAVVTFFFHPDGTVGFENAALQSVGRVPYIDAHGKYKSPECLVNEMAVKMIQDYAR